LPFSRGVGVGEALTVGKRTAAMGAKGGGDGTTWLVGGAEGAEAPTSTTTSSRRAKTSASLALFSSFSTMPASELERGKSLVNREELENQCKYELTDKKKQSSVVRKIRNEFLYQYSQQAQLGCIRS